MDPNNNQPIGTNPQQPVAPKPVATPPLQPVAPDAPQNADGNPKKVVGKGIILIVILILLVVGMAAYILFAKIQMNSSQKTTTDNSSSVMPSPTAVPTLAPEEDLEVASPEADLIDLEADVKAL